MIRKKVLVHGTANTLKEFLQSPFSREYEILAFISDDFEGIDTAPQDNGTGSRQFLALKDVNDFAYRIVDGVVLTDKNNRRADINYFLAHGTEPRQIILWDKQGLPEPFTFKEEDGVPVVLMEGLQFHIRGEDDFKFMNQIRYHLLRQRQFYSLQPPQYKNFIEVLYKRNTGKNIHWEEPETLTEKIQWLKLYDATPLKTRLADKYMVRNRIARTIGERYLIPLLGVWDDFDDIDFDDLPDQFVLKCNHGCGMNIIVRDKASFDKQAAREKINAWLSFDWGVLSGELHYNAIKKKILAEEFLTDGKSLDINDYKFWCFDGHVEYIQVDKNRSTNHVQRFYSTDWRLLPFIIADHTPDNQIAEKPATLDEMLNIAATLSKGFSIVRVDLYCVGDRIYFGEMTFTPLSGYMKWSPDDTDRKIGALIKLEVGNE